ncbi:hypothetical protein HHI36_014108 [Cryptolaemus montrouzieri]|uniref:Uncharacterized protein n=1 Tax=Cryptolaemus montrouzieri TaxID=559131 RepID=A0ABD2N1I6_9CUCU
MRDEETIQIIGPATLLVDRMDKKKFRIARIRKGRKTGTRDIMKKRKMRIQNTEKKSPEEQPEKVSEPKIIAKKTTGEDGSSG